MLEEETEEKCVLHFTVTDTGIGIANKFREKILPLFNKAALQQAACMAEQDWVSVYAGNWLNP